MSLLLGAPSGDDGLVPKHFSYFRLLQTSRQNLAQRQIKTPRRPPGRFVIGFLFGLDFLFGPSARLPGSFPVLSLVGGGD